MKTVARRMERERWFGKDEDKTKNRERKTKGSKRAAFPVYPQPFWTLRSSPRPPGIQSVVGRTHYIDSLFSGLSFCLHSQLKPWGLPSPLSLSPGPGRGAPALLSLQCHFQTILPVSSLESPTFESTANRANLIFCHLLTLRSPPPLIS